jgi:predicted PurR-regulated permease PerM
MQIRNVFYTLAVVILIFFLLIVGKSLLIPLVLAFFIWYLINVLTRTIENASLRGHHIPRAIALTLAILAILGILGFLFQLVSSNIVQVVEAAPQYQTNLERLVARAFDLLNIEEPPELDTIFKKVNLGSIISRMARTLADFLGDAGLILIYLLFLFMEQKTLSKKLNALIPDTKRRKDVLALIHRIDSDIRTYVGMKTLVSLLTAVLGYLIMRTVRLDYAEFWAILILVLNFIPNIGSIAATLLPALLALVQFETTTPFFIVLGGITASQVIVANVIEPRLMGKSLNLSPLIIILSLVLWGAVWGIPGMFLCVPITAVLMIVFSHFSRTRKIACILSRDGRVLRIKS